MLCYEVDILWVVCGSSWPSPPDRGRGADTNTEEMGCLITAIMSSVRLAGDVWMWLGEARHTDSWWDTSHEETDMDCGRVWKC